MCTDDIPEIERTTESVPKLKLVKRTMVTLQFEDGTEVEVPEEEVIPIDPSEGPLPQTVSIWRLTKNQKSYIAWVAERAYVRWNHDLLESDAVPIPSSEMATILKDSILQEFLPGWMELTIPEIEAIVEQYYNDPEVW